MKPWRIILFTALMLGTGVLLAQPYEHSIGVRAGTSSGISYKGFFRHRMMAVEVHLFYNRHGLNAGALAEYHLEPFRNKRWLLYLGGGPFGGQWDQLASVGVSAILGMEYVMRDLPLHFSLDWKPMMNIQRDFEVELPDFGATIRYYFSL